VVYWENRIQILELVDRVITGCRQAKASNNSFMKHVFKGKKKGRPKKAYGDTTVVTQRRKKPGSVPHSKKPPPNPAPIETAPSEAKKRASDEAPDGVYFKVKKRRINWGEGAEKVKLDATIKEWAGGGRCVPDRSGGPLSLRGFSGFRNIPYETF
jgi:hypothetical protein